MIEDTKELIRNCKSKNTLHNGLELEDTKGVIRNCKSKNREQNCQKKMDKRTNNDLPKHTHKPKDQDIRTPYKSRMISCAPEV